MASHLRVSRQWVRRRWLVLALLALMSVMISTTGLSPATAQQGGLGVGRGHGLEVGINLPALNQIRTEINQGVYTRPCTDEEHDRHRWHTLVDPVRKCYYDHHHGDDPNYVNDIFGEPGAWYGVPGQSVSYPWQTFPAAHAYESNEAYLGSGRMENEAKHEGYYWVVRRDQPCNTDNGRFCVKDFRVQFHGIMAVHDAAVRWHSMSAEVRVCRDVSDLSTCGIIRTGGWMDHGRLFDMNPAQDSLNRVLCGHGGEYNGLLRHIVLPADTLYFPLPTTGVLIDENRCHPILTPQMIAAGPTTGYAGTGPQVEWWAHGASDFRYQLQVLNPLSNIRETAPGSGEIVDEFLCRAEDTHCAWNQSIMTMRLQYIVSVNSYFVNGYVSGDRVNLRLQDGRFIDRFGGLQPGCTTPGLDCIPIEYSNVYLSVNPGQGLAGFSHTPCERCEKVDYDLSPPGRQWITWFYRKYTDHEGEHDGGDDNEHTSPVEPTPAPEGPAVVVNINNPSPSVGESVIVALELHNVSGVYGLQAECVVNPVVLAGTERIDGSGFNSGNSFFVDTGFNPGNGHWLVAASRLAGDGQPAEGISGNATAFMLAYDVISGGDSQVNCAVLVVDANGSTIDVEVINGSLISETPTDPTPPPTPMPLPPTPDPEPQPEPDEPSRITGATQYQNRVSNDGIQVELVDTSTGSLVEAVAAGADGAYSFDAVPVGNYEMVISAPQHIPVVYPVEVAADGTLITMEPSVLRAGDVDNNGRVDIIDATFVGANFGLDAVPEIAHIDLNGDGVINITDLVLVGSNFGLTSPLTQ